MDSGMFYGLQQGAIAALEMSPEWFAKLNETYRRRRSRMEDLATKLNVMIEPEGVGLFLWAKLPEKHSDSEAFIDKILQEQHIFITPGTIFGNRGAGYIRFSLCVPETTIEEAIKRLES